MSSPETLVMHRDGLPVHRQSPIQVVTGPGVKQLQTNTTPSSSSSSDAKRSAEASRRCDCSPERSVLR